MNINVQLGMRIRYLRKQKGLSQEDLALEAGINKNYLSDLERGTRNATITVVEKIATALEVSLSTLFKGIQSFEDWYILFIEQGAKYAISNFSSRYG